MELARTCPVNCLPEIITLPAGGRPQRRNVSVQCTRILAPARAGRDATTTRNDADADDDADADADAEVF